ncbi:MAG: hypothetical protein K2U26_15075, partial [Cyclobacteriaceae bacterium]|nr:hypothetical protein [Cyclobacteriaceae bacterium]
MSYTRRDFLNLTGGAYLAGTLSSFSQPMKAVNQPGFSLVIMATNWGFSGSTMEFCKKAKQAGYDGIEIWLPSDANERVELASALKQHSLQVGFLVGGWDQDFAWNIPKRVGIQSLWKSSWRGGIRRSSWCHAA